MGKVYLYESCLPTLKGTNKNTLIIQNQKLFFTNNSNTFFKDNDNLCWNYLGEADDSYIPPQTVFSVNYVGNFFTKQKNLQPVLFPNCESCNSTYIGSCNETYFSAKTCDSGTTIIVKTCNNGISSDGNKLSPSIGDVCGIYNPTGDDFCVTLDTLLTTGTTDYVVNTPYWITYICETCPIQKHYIVNSCDGTIINKKIYDNKDSETLSASTVVRINTDSLCYEIVSYEGVKLNYGYDEGKSPTIIKNFSSCYECLLDYYNSLSL